MAEKAALLDVDGTLVDANYQHAIAWYRAFREFDITLPIWRIHRAIGMGGDQLVPALLGQEVDREILDLQEGRAHGPNSGAGRNSSSAAQSLAAG